VTLLALDLANVARWLLLCLVSANIGGLAVVCAMYARRERESPWWARLLPAHVWRVVLGALVLIVGTLIRTVKAVDHDVRWWGLPFSLLGNALIAWGIGYMIVYQRHKLHALTQPVGFRREEDPPLRTKTDPPEPRRATDPPEGPAPERVRRPGRGSRSTDG
jgi:hypothetical protein